MGHLKNFLEFGRVFSAVNCVLVIARASCIFALCTFFRGLKLQSTLFKRPTTFNLNVLPLSSVKNRDNLETFGG